ncbi:Pectic acid lyase [Rubripirellula tenax]|uniref:Pectic acid lyase n=1 Tax=Rubripirellula tenax TaxID=2528015 RepID=A0A5C6F2X2_9BACT|nr:pectate lyase [Rubripirellula tenax]TWU54396.1 Pectic acid lyase [Rubripirellula tenax]
MRSSFRWLCLIVACLAYSAARADEGLRQRAIDTMRAASSYFHGNVASHGGYVYHYSLDLADRSGEGVTTKDQIWVQPPGTPTVGLAFLSAYAATGDRFSLDAAIDAGNALRYGQLKSGGWTSSIDFDPKGTQSADYRNGRGRGKNYSTLDDGKSQSAIQFLVRLDEATEFKNEEIHDAVSFGLNAMIGAQFSNGGFPQAWPGANGPRPGLHADFPDYDWRIEHRIKEYWFLPTLNDDVPGEVARTLVEAYRVYKDERFMESLRRLGDFLLLAQLPEPQPGYAQQYTSEMKPAWARKFEPPAVASDETQEVLFTLMLIAQQTNERKYWKPIEPAMKWLERSQLDDGSFARFYELQTNRPLYMNRSGDTYSLTHDDSDLPGHYSWKIKSKLPQLRKSLDRLRAGQSLESFDSLSTLTKKAVTIVDSLDESKRWVDVSDGSRMVGQFTMASGQRFLSSETFSKNLTTLSQFVGASKE